ncbi:glycoside hydrolase family 9 protein [Gilvimarinus xylanilyticus]|uniref:Glycoside hydrolase family 9 protein n=1 Tax=Gilvimarinus xylanilyticus TaxID=2944139 RepID=A0A9X2HZP8_9GAMM|nr:glycoside hydrolase family 9 protein [Gilvimarinus xylanilyticus]
MTNAPQSFPVVKCIVVDQFGYLPNADKTAILRSPQEGFDAATDYTPGDSFDVVNLDTGEVVHSGAPSQWGDGAVNSTSGDRVWWFDFSGVSAEGRYAIVDADQNLRSAEFQITSNVYRPVLIQAVRTFFYQRAGFAKRTPYAEAAWADEASHIKPGQDTEARLYSATNDASTERDLSGGWYDAGDYNKYTSWHAGYLLGMMEIYNDRPSVWTDDFNLPESGNGIPDLADEIKWGMDWLIKMQEADGSVLSVMGLDHGSPPSSADGPSVYGPATTNASVASAAAFALGAEFFTQFGNEALNAYASDLLNRAQQAWTWADANPSVTFRNSDSGVAAGEQEVDDNGRRDKKLIAAVYLFAATDETVYRDYVDANKPNIYWVSPWNEELNHALLVYASLPNATKSVADTLNQQYRQSMQGTENWAEVNNNTDAYRAFIGDGNFTWGSTRTMAVKGATFYHLKKFAIANASDSAVDNVAMDYLHYIHGVNPLGKVYLSNMGEYGAEDSVDSFYHSWFTDGSANWDSVSESNYGPAPGFVVGGANPQYGWDGCCPDSCGGSANNARCGMAPPSPPANQPPMKSYADFNDGWPINSWSVTENSNGYQLAYIRLLSKFVD